MERLTFKRRKFLPFLKSGKERRFFIVLNTYLILGVCAFLVTIIYLAGHLNNSDSIITYCIPGFAMGISSPVVYFIGYESLMSERQNN